MGPPRRTGGGTPARRSPVAPSRREGVKSPRRLPPRRPAPPALRALPLGPGLTFTGREAQRACPARLEPGSRRCPGPGGRQPGRAAAAGPGPRAGRGRGRRARPAAAAHLRAGSGALPFGAGGASRRGKERWGDGRGDCGSGRRRPPSAGHAPAWPERELGRPARAAGARRKAPCPRGSGLSRASLPPGWGWRRGAADCSLGAERLGILALVTWKCWPGTRTGTSAFWLKAPLCPRMQTCLRAGALWIRPCEWDVELVRVRPQVQVPGAPVPWCLHWCGCLEYGAGRACITCSARTSPRQWLQGRPCPRLAQKGVLTDLGSTTALGLTPLTTPPRPRPLTRARPSYPQRAQLRKVVHPPPSSAVFSFQKAAPRIENSALHKAERSLPLPSSPGPQGLWFHMPTLPAPTEGVGAQPVATHAFR